MPTLTLKSLPDPLYQRLKAQAAAHRRSLNSEIIVLLERAVAATPRDVATTLAEIDAIHARLHLPVLTEEEITAAKHEGRP